MSTSKPYLLKAFLEYNIYALKELISEIQFEECFQTPVEQQPWFLNITKSIKKLLVNDISMVRFFTEPLQLTQSSIKSETTNATLELQQIPCLICDNLFNSPPDLLHHVNSLHSKIIDFKKCEEEQKEPQIKNKTITKQIQQNQQVDANDFKILASKELSLAVSAQKKQPNIISAFLFERTWVAIDTSSGFCPFCYEQYSGATYFKKHLIKHHFQSMKKTDIKPLYGKRGRPSNSFVAQKQKLEDAQSNNQHM